MFIKGKKPLDSIKKLSDKITSLFEESQLNRLAKETGFIQRKSSQLTAGDFLQLMTTELLQEPTTSYEGLCERLSEMNPQVSLTPQALEQRVNSQGAVNYLSKVLELAMAKSVEPVVEKIEPKLLAPFKHVFLQDSTQFSLHEKLASQFKGAGGSASKAGGKIDLVYELKTQRIAQLQVSESTIPDQSRAEDFLEKLQEKDLLIRDLGYFSLQALQKCVERKAYFVSRLLQSVDVYLTPDAPLPLDVIEYINRHYKNRQVIELSVFIGKTAKLPTRLIIYRLPQEIVSQRRYEARKNAKKKGRTPTQHYLASLEFNFFITNVPSELWSPLVVGTIYRLRWQIELRFKEWKSLLEIHLLKGTRSERIQCWLYGRLICLVIIALVCGWADWYALESICREISFDKTIKWLKRKARLATAIQKETLPAMLGQLAAQIYRLCKQKRKRKTTLELVDNQINYMDSFCAG